MGFRFFVLLITFAGIPWWGTTAKAGEMGCHQQLNRELGGAWRRARILKFYCSPGGNKAIE